MSILVTGGAGFIGSNFLHHMQDEDVVCIDSLTYASNVNNLPHGTSWYKCDINDCEHIFRKEKVKTIFHFAAESHVDRSIEDCSNFIHSNINGTVNLLNLAVKYDIEKFIHISTDEVYGSIDKGKFTEDSNFNPKNPYSASKASSNHFVNAYHNTYGLPTVIVNGSNNYGARQHEEKLVARTFINALQDKPIPIHGDGSSIRDWLYVDDFCDAILKASDKGKFGETYNVGGECELTNIDMVNKIHSILGKQTYIEHVKDRPGVDKRYAIDNKKVKKDLTWEPKTDIIKGLERTMEYYEYILSTPNS